MTDPAVTITTRFAVPGLHRWPDAPDRRSYLRHPHRHLFRVEVTCRVSHDEREVEFHDLAEAAEVIFRNEAVPWHPDASLLNFGARSCESMARTLGHTLQAAGYPILSVTVSEDGENDSTWRTA